MKARWNHPKFKYGAWKRLNRTLPKLNMEHESKMKPHRNTTWSMETRKNHRGMNSIVWNQHGTIASLNMEPGNMMEDGNIPKLNMEYGKLVELSQVYIWSVAFT